MGILIFLSVRSNTDQIRMELRLFKAHLACSRNRVLNLLMDKLNIVLWRRQRQTLNGYFSVNNEKKFFLICDEKADLSEMC